MSTQLVNLLSDGLPWAVFIVVVIARQFIARPIDPSSLFTMPLILGIAGLWLLTGSPPKTLTVAAVLLINIALGATMGLLRGVTVRIWQTPEGKLMRQATVLTFVLWVVTIVLKVAIGFGSHTGFTPDDFVLPLAVTLAAQNLVLRARTAGLLPAGTPVGSR